MRGIRQRTKHLIIAGLVGASVAGIPLLIAYIFLLTGSLAAHQEVETYEKLIGSLDTCEVYILNTDKERGERIESKDVQRIEVMKKMGLPSLLPSKQVVGQVTRTSLRKGTVLTDSLVQPEELLASDVRRIELDYIKLPNQLAEGDMIDIRISFPTGEDYIVIGQRKVLSFVQGEEFVANDMVEIFADEEEILKLSSAKTDEESYPDILLYAVRYAEQEQQMPQDTYPVNPHVFELSKWDPNVMKALLTDDNLIRRQALEEHMGDLMRTTLQDLYE